MRRAWPVLWVVACGCTRAVPAPALPEPVSVSVVAAEGLEELVPATAEHARARLVAHRHAVEPDAAHALELELISVGGELREGRYEYCVKLAGRDRLTGFEAVKQRCDVVGFGSGVTDGAAAVYKLAVAVTTVVALEKSEPRAQSRLYLDTLDELTDVLGREAVSRPRPAGSWAARRP